MAFLVALLSINQTISVLGKVSLIGSVCCQSSLNSNQTNKFLSSFKNGAGTLLSMHLITTSIYEDVSVDCFVANH